MSKKYEAEKVLATFNSYRSFKNATVLPLWKLIYSLYNGDFWDIFKTQVEDFTVTPETNYFELHVQAFSNSVYSGAFIGNLSPVKAGDEDNIQNLNAFIEQMWNKTSMKNKYLSIGRMGELFNFAPVRVESIDKNGDVVVKTLTQDEVYIDPQVPNYKEGEAIFIERAVNIDSLMSDSDFGDAVKKYDKENGKSGYANKTLSSKMSGENAQVNAKNRMVSLIEGFLKGDDGKIDQVFILDEKEIIYTKEDLALDNFPIVIFQPDKPEGQPYGTPKLKKVLNSVIALNLLDSLEATQPYRILHRPRFVDVRSNIDLRAFADYGNTPGAVFPVQGDPDRLIMYQDIPVLPPLDSLKFRIEQSIEKVTGVDPAYRGRETNSIQTTGATQAFQARVTMLTDNSRITQLEEFTEDLTRLMLEFYMLHGGNKDYEVPILSPYGTNKVVDTKKINFLDDFGTKEPDTYDEEGNLVEGKKIPSKFKYKYNLAASVLLPMNQANLFDSAKALYEMQGQYQFKTPIVTEEDIVRFSDFPQKDLWLQRLQKAKLDNIQDDVESTFKNAFLIYSRLISQGIDEATAAEQTIQILVEEKQQLALDPSMGRGFE